MPQTPDTSFAIAALDASKVEDPRGVTSYTFTVTRTGDTSTAATLAYAVSGSGANPATAADFVGSGAISVNAQGIGGQFWGYSGQDVIFPSCVGNFLAGVGGDTLSASGGIFNTFASLTGGVLMDGSHATGRTTFFGGATGMDTFIAGGDPANAKDSMVIATGANASTVQLGGGKATVFANGSSTITSGAGSADLVFNDRTGFLLNAVAPGSTRVFALFNFVPGTEHVSLQNYNPNAAAQRPAQPGQRAWLHAAHPAGPDARPAARHRPRRRQRVRLTCQPTAKRTAG